MSSEPWMGILLLIAACAHSDKNCGRNLSKANVNIRLFDRIISELPVNGGSLQATSEMLIRSWDITGVNN